MSFFLIYILGYLTGINIIDNPIKIIGILIISAPSLIGLGFFIAGIILYFKKADGLQAFVYLLIVGLVSLPMIESPIYKFIPFAYGSYVVKSYSALLTVDTFDLLVIAINSIVYFTLGILSFKFFERKAKNYGTLTQSH